MASKHGSHWLEREDFGDVTVVRIKVPRLGDDDTTKDIFHQIIALVGDIGRRKLVLNLAASAHLPSLALGKLVLLNRKAEAAQGRLALCHLSAMAVEALKVTHLTELFSIYETEPEAVQSFT